MSVAFLRLKIIRQKKEVMNHVAGASEGSFFYGEKKYKRDKQNNIEKREKHLQLF